VLFMIECQVRNLATASMCVYVCEPLCGRADTQCSSQVNYTIKLLKAAQRKAHLSQDPFSPAAASGPPVVGSQALTINVRKPAQVRSGADALPRCLGRYYVVVVLVSVCGF
jgi:hypothetical protein